MAVSPQCAENVLSFIFAASLWASSTLNSSLQVHLVVARNHPPIPNGRQENSFGTSFRNMAASVSCFTRSSVILPMLTALSMRSLQRVTVFILKHDAVVIHEKDKLEDMTFSLGTLYNCLNIWSASQPPCKVNFHWRKLDLTPPGKHSTCCEQKFCNVHLLERQDLTYHLLCHRELRSTCVGFMEFGAVLWKHRTARPTQTTSYLGSGDSKRADA